MRAFVDAMNAQDWAAIDRLVAPDFVRHSDAAGAPGVRSRDDLKWFIRNEYTTFPDAHETVEDLVAEGDRVAARHLLTGTQQGPFGDHPPSGREIQASYLALYRLKGGQIVEAWAEWDNLSLMTQMGLHLTQAGTQPSLHEFLDVHYDSDGDKELARRLAEGADLTAREGQQAETPLHVATRCRRASAVTALLDGGADIDATTTGGKTAFAHAIRRRFTDIVDLLAARGASPALTDADRLAVAVVDGKLDEARTMLDANPGGARTGNPEEDRLLADVAGRASAEAVALLIAAGADLTATGLDAGTPLHQAAWFGQPENARLLIDAGAPLDLFDATHDSSPLGWAVHGSRYSGDAAAREADYVELARMLLEAGSSLHYPDRPGDDAYRQRLLADASTGVERVLQERDTKTTDQSPVAPGEIVDDARAGMHAAPERGAES